LKAIEFGTTAPKPHGRSPRENKRGKTKLPYYKIRLGAKLEDPPKASQKTI
jgi:hypothetical protein